MNINSTPSTERIVAVEKYVQVEAPDFGKVLYFNQFDELIANHEDIPSILQDENGDHACLLVGYGFSGPPLGG